MQVTSPLIHLTPVFALALALPCFATDELPKPARTDSFAAVRALAKSRTSPAELVRAALDQAAAGDTSRWDYYLTKAIETDADFAPARWQAGYTRVGDRWLTFDEASRIGREDELSASYRRLRDARADTAEGHLKLAHWCSNNGLEDEARAHLIQVLIKEPNNSAAHVALGDRLIDGVWIDAETIEQATLRQARVRDAIRRWTPELDQIRLRLEDRDPNRRAAGRSRLVALAETQIIPVMERALSLRSEALAKEVLDVLVPMDDPEATLSIARHALFSSWPGVRDAAVDHLKERPFDHFVPMLISNLRGSIQSQYAIVIRSDGRPFYEHVLFRAGFEADERVVFDNKYVRIRQRILTPRITQARIAQFNREISAREHSVDVQNSQSEAFNERIIAVLTATTEADLGSDPNDWWKWWENYNGLYVVRDKKPVSNQRYTARILVSCFVAGTSVWTSTGPVPIELVQPGDRLLAQDPETGELAYKCVLRTTVRPPSPLVRITANEESFAATPGHPFWVNGTGWVVARSIKGGDLLYSAGGGHPVESIDDNLDAEPTYNLVVADFHTYFIGEGRFLVHDNSDRKPTAAKVPGQR
jgi:hypothetical protein